MYIITVDGSSSNILHDSAGFDNDYKLISGNLKLAFNKAGSFSMTVPPNNEMYSKGLLKRMKSVLDVYKKKQDGSWQWLWRGRILDINRNFYNTMSYNCEGWLSVLNDSLVRPDTNYNTDTGITNKTIPDYFVELINKHNAQVGSARSLNPIVKKNGQTVWPTTKPTFPVGNYESTFEYIESNFLNNESIGGRIWIERNNIYYLPDDTLDDDDLLAEQPIIFGENMLDYAETVDATEVYTVIVPTGKDDLKLKDADHNNRDYLEASSNSINTYGRIWHYENFPNAATQAELKKQAKAALDKNVTSATTIELSAFDLSLIDSSIEMIPVGKRLRIISRPHQLDISGYLCVEADIDLCNPANTKYIIGIDPKTLTGKQVSMLKKFKNGSNWNTKYGVDMKLKGDNARDNILVLDRDTLDNFRLA